MLLSCFLSIDVAVGFAFVGLRQRVTYCLKSKAKVTLEIFKMNFTNQYFTNQWQLLFK